MMVSTALQAFVLPGAGVFPDCSRLYAWRAKVDVLQQPRVCLTFSAALLPPWEVRQLWQSLETGTIS